MLRRSLVLVTVDCLRADHVGFNGYRGGTTPFLDSLAAESFTFANAIAAGAPTYYSFPGIMASRPPLSFGRDLVGLAPGEPTLATALKESGYVTAAFLAANPYLSPNFGYQEGFDTFHDSLRAELASDHRSQKNGLRTRLNRAIEQVSHRLGPIGSIYDDLYFEYCQRVAPPAGSFDALRRFPSADVLVEQALTWVASVGDQPFFLWLHFMDPHSPYYPVQQALEQMGREMSVERARYVNANWMRPELRNRRLLRYRDEVIALYNAGIRWVDAQMERFVAALREQGRWENCALALTADHGEEFLDHGGRYHPPSKVTDELIRVPLLMRFPDNPGSRVGSVFSLIDLAPTLLDLLQVPGPKTFCGVSRRRSLGESHAWNANAIVECVPCTNPFRRDSRLGRRILAVRGERYKLVIDFANPREQYFDLEADPDEKTPLAADAPADVRRELMKCAREHLARSVGAYRESNQRLSTHLRDLRRALLKPGAPLPV